MLPRVRTSLLFRVTLPESYLLASFGKAKPFHFARLCRSPTCFLPWARTSLFFRVTQLVRTRLSFHVTLPESCLLASSGVDKPFLSHDSAGVPPTCFLVQRQAFSLRDSAGVLPACFLGRGQAFSFARLYRSPVYFLPRPMTSHFFHVTLSETHLQASSGED